MAGWGVIARSRGRYAVWMRVGALKRKRWLRLRGLGSFLTAPDLLLAIQRDYQLTR
jgi:hypothetical protein